MIGNGPNRGSPTTWMGIDGYNWAPGVTIRWGTNIPEAGRRSRPGSARKVFTTWFDEKRSRSTPRTRRQAATGDSGGAVFHGSDLAGIMIAIGLFTNQPANTTLYGTAHLQRGSRDVSRRDRRAARADRRPRGRRRARRDAAPPPRSTLKFASLSRYSLRSEFALRGE